MAAIQDTYNNAPATGYPGMVANGETSNRISRDVADAAGIGFGKFAWISGDRGATITPASGTCLGVVMSDHGLAPVPGGVAQDIVPQGRSAGIMTKGAIYVASSTAAAKNAQVYVTSAGLISNSSSGNTIAPNWFYDDTLASAGVTRIANRA